ncbi:MAG: SMC-Scp complex subunit ScpB [Promicromonosporaceae bacterium]|nr:SMC-Scp complex subunit ScpB [Promicromonosporaceae bacterium]
MTEHLETTLEALLIVAAEPVSTARLAVIAARPPAEVAGALQALAAEYRGQGGGRPRGFELREGVTGWRLYSSPDYAEAVASLLLEGATSRLSQAALETLAVVAYRQPVTRGQISAVRGVNVDGVMRTLLARDLVAEVGADPGTGAVLFGTTPEFLDRLGLASLADLPPIAPHLPDLDTLTEVEG